MRLQHAHCRCCAGFAYVVLWAVGVASTQAVMLEFQGTIRYTGRTGAEAAAGTNQSFPVRGARVELWDANGPFFADTLVATQFTDGSGLFSITTSNADRAEAGANNKIDAYIKVFPRSAPALPAAGGVKSSYKVVMPGPKVAGKETIGGDYIFQSATTLEAAANVNFSNTFTAGTNINGAFSVFDALTTTSRSYSALPGTSNNTIPALFPTTETPSFFRASNPSLHILLGDRFDWDVTSHEYGHYVQSLHGISNSPGGSHSSNDNLRFSRLAGGDEATKPSPSTLLNRRQADRLGWGEGWATYFGLEMQSTGTPAGVQRAGDVIYHDNTDADGVSCCGNRYGIENYLINPRFTFGGEDNEAAVARVLWDLADATNDAADRDRVNLGRNALFNIVDNANVTSLDGLWDELVNGPGTTNQQRIDYGAIFQAHNVSPTLDASGVSGDVFFLGLGDPPPTFKWFEPTGGDANHNYGNDLLNRYGLKFFDSSFNEILDTGVLGDVISWTPDAATWLALLNTLDDISYIVYGQSRTTELVNPANPLGGNFVYTTGNYWSDALNFSVTPIPEPGTFAMILAGAVPWLVRPRASRRVTA